MIYEYKLMWFVILYIMYKIVKLLEIYINILSFKSVFYRNLFFFIDL